MVIKDRLKNWSNKSIGSILSLEYGKPLKDSDRYSGKIPVYGSNGVIGFHNKFIVKGPGVIVGRKGSAGEVSLSIKDFYPIDTTFYVNTKLSIKYVYYLLKNFNLTKLVGSSAVPGLNRNDVYSEDVLIPDNEEEQKNIAEILSSLDDKIELNRKINDSLEKIARSLFKRWFIDFEFPDKDGKPYKSSGGKMIDSELGKIPDGWKIENLGYFFPVVTGKKDANVAGKIGKYPFFSCSQDVLYTDEYSFDSSSLLLAGNGDFNIKLYEGKFEAYQRTYILTPYKKELIGFLLFLISAFLDEITAGHRGSVIKFITKGMIENFKISVPPDNELTKMADIFYEISKSIDFYKKENDNLSQIRDSLLPKLMSGKISV